MAEFLAIAHLQDASTFSLILTQSSPELIQGPLEKSGVPKQGFLIRGVRPGEIPRYLRAADIGLSFKMPNYSAAATSPTKVAEYLAVGLPVISNAGIGDTDKIIESNAVGVILRDFRREAYLSALGEADELCCDPEIATRCIATARSRFDLESIGGERYCRLYRRLLGSPEHALAGAIYR